MTRRIRRFLLPAAALLLTACGAGGSDAAPAHGPLASEAKAPGPAAEHSLAGAPALPGLGPVTRAQVPAAARQAVVVTGRDRNSPVSEAVLYERSPAGWQATRSWPAHNALNGWTDDHSLGDLRSPVGVYTLTGAGGLLPDPGTRLPYDHSSMFTATGAGFGGEPLAGSFDYVVAIDYNRRPGTSPLDGHRPLGSERGGGIWFHVDHGGPTQACVTVRRAHMKELLRALDPGRYPVVVMGDAASLAR
ncbi:L,D-transpeptidase family protein [Streptomyces chromofuscus]|uniref:Lipoprotein n=1 Tax=Streptomyces chromofuscus TaxID=42881 RepID=A0A7M2TA14_STRCW|nr:L,D-transpeptidase family protein [Streptomyces chromofuscus]QOV44969.1 hypothetical protein IPT68_02910 [Streptomyces chromofuscus]GGT28777.1 lipoprotein [Streptomyces chromofuscus]